MSPPHTHTLFLCLIFTHTHTNTRSHPSLDLVYLQYYENYRKLERMTARQRAMVGNETALEFEGGLDVLNQKPKKELTEEEVITNNRNNNKAVLEVLSFHRACHGYAVLTNYRLPFTFFSSHLLFFLSFFSDNEEG